MKWLHKSGNGAGDGASAKGPPSAVIKCQTLRPQNTLTAGSGRPAARPRRHHRLGRRAQEGRQAHPHRCRNCRNCPRSALGGSPALYKGRGITPHVSDLYWGPGPQTPAMRGAPGRPQWAPGPQPRAPYPPPQDIAHSHLPVHSLRAHMQPLYLLLAPLDNAAPDPQVLGPGSPFSCSKAWTPPATKDILARRSRLPPWPLPALAPPRPAPAAPLVASLAYYAFLWHFSSPGSGSGAVRCGLDGP